MPKHPYRHNHKPNNKRQAAHEYDFAHDRPSHESQSQHDRRTYQNAPVVQPLHLTPNNEQHHPSHDFYDIPHRFVAAPRQFSPKLAMWIVSIFVILNVTIALIVDYNANRGVGDAIKAKTTAASITSPDVSLLKPESSTLPVLQADGKLLYTSTQYGFTLVYPVTWAKVTVQSSTIASTDKIKPVGRLIFQSPAVDALTAAKEIMRLRIDTTETYVELIQSLKDTPNQMPTFIGKAGQNVVSLETALPAITPSQPATGTSLSTPSSGSAATSQNVPVTSAVDYSKDIQAVVASFAVVGAPASSTTTPAPAGTQPSSQTQKP